MFFSSGRIYIDPLFLENNNPFFKKLPASEKEKFISRLHHFISEKNFEGREDLQVTDEIKILISSAAIQLTFGFKAYLLPRFSTIIIYPTTYFSKSGNAYHNGETSAAGAIVFAWDFFKKGFAFAHDRINLGLHEWAHALMVSGFFGDGGVDEHFKLYYNKWQMEAQDEFAGIEQFSELFREYGGTNVPEFFAICTEVFFEDPEGFKEKAPSLFKHFCILLNQFPIGNLEALNKEIIEENNIEKDEIPGKIRMIITPEKSQFVQMIVIQSFLFVIILIGGLIIEAYNAAIIATLIIIYVVARTTYEELKFRNKLAISSNHISIRNRNDVVLGDYFFRQLTNIHLSDKTAAQEIYFNYLQDGKIEEKRFRFRYTKEKIDALREVLKNNNVPFTFSSAKK